MVQFRLLSTLLIISLQHPTKRVLQVLSWFDYKMDLWVSDSWKPMAFDCWISMQVYVTADEIDNTVSVFWNSNRWLCQVVAYKVYFSVQNYVSRSMWDLGNTYCVGGRICKSTTMYRFFFQWCRVIFIDGGCDVLSKFHMLIVNGDIFSGRGQVSRGCNWWLLLLHIHTRAWVESLSL